MKTKTKNSIKRGKNGGKFFSRKSYPASYLVLILTTVLTLESLALLVPVSDWYQGFALLDFSSQLRTTVSSTSAVLQPAVDVISGIDRFYELGADQMIYLLGPVSEFRISDLGLFVVGVDEFYQQASAQLTTLLDVSGSNFWPGIVAGASIEK